MIILQILATVIVISGGWLASSLSSPRMEELRKVEHRYHRCGKFYFGSEGSTGEFTELFWLVLSIGVPLLAIWIK